MSDYTTEPYRGDYLVIDGIVHYEYWRYDDVSWDHECFPRYGWVCSHASTEKTVEDWLKENPSTPLKKQVS